MEAPATVVREAGEGQAHSVDDPGSGDAIWVAAPFALVGTFFLARSLPIHFRPPSNPLGIVSWSTRTGYAPFQELFWYGFALSVGTLLAWGLVRILPRRQPPARQACLEALAALTLLGIVFLGPLHAVLLTLLCGGAVARVLMGSPQPARGTEVELHDAFVRRYVTALLAVYVVLGTLHQSYDQPISISSTLPPVGVVGVLAFLIFKELRTLRFALAAVAVALLLSPYFWQSVLDVVWGTPDQVFATNDWYFQAEIGQHLAWADAVLNGQAPGRDFFTLYGPLYPIGAVAAWALVGRSVAGWLLYYTFLNVLAMLAAMALAARLIRRRALCLLLPVFLLPIVLGISRGIEPRYGLALAGLACLILAFERNSVRWVAAAGTIAGVGLLFSQEFALVFLVCTAVAFSVRARSPEALGFVAGFAVGIAPCLLWLAWVGALGPMLHDLVGYPSWVAAGFGKLPFLSAELFPISLSDFQTQGLELRLDYATPAVCWAALLWAVRIDRIDPRHPIVSLKTLRAELVSDPHRLGVGLLALFGLLAFRFALGRSTFQNTIRVCGASAILLCVGLDRPLGIGQSSRVLATWRVTALVGIVLLGGFVSTAQPVAWYAFKTTAEIAFGLAPRLKEPVSSQHEEIVEVLRWIEGNARPTDEVLFLPNHAGCYYLTNRRSPIRFVLGTQMVTNTHRAEALARLRASPPRFVVYSTNSWKVDGIPHRAYMGEAIFSWIRTSYYLKTQIGGVDIFELRPPTLLKEVSP